MMPGQTQLTRMLYLAYYNHGRRASVSSRQLPLEHFQKMSKCTVLTSMASLLVRLTIAALEALYAAEERDEKVHRSAPDYTHRYRFK